MNKFLGSILIVLTVCFLALAGYVYYVYKKAPGIKEKVTGLYQLFSADQAAVPAETLKKQANAGWTTINMKTSDEAIKRLSSMSDAEIKEKFGEVKELDGLMNGAGLKLVKAAADILAKNRDNAVMSDGDEKQIKAMLGKIMDDYEKNIAP